MIQSRNHVFLPGRVTKKLDDLKRELELPSRPQVISRLVSEHETSKVEQGKSYANFQIMRDSTPVVITGQSGLGKTVTIKKLLSGWKGNIFVLDYIGEYVVDEYQEVELRQVSSAEAWAYQWDKGGRIRVVPSSDVAAAPEMAGMLLQLAALMRQAGKPLEKWLIVVEEADHFTTDPNFKSLLGESRHFVGKLLVSLKRSAGFKEVAPVYRPFPWTRS